MPSQAIRRSYIAGTANSTVARWAAIVSHSAAGSKRPRITARDPVSRLRCTPLSPCWCESGSAWTSTSSALQRHASITPRVEARTLPCVSGTPFGAPVVPEV